MCSGCGPEHWLIRAGRALPALPLADRSGGHDDGDGVTL
ncbi:hypothetical protein EBBID32_6890 [Sphingobium indicum BiD32]|uniref:Uncharacterized protein n=1 Tax=Sphingobium indicum BiD32 TaxID=1301087 RepID=N1MLL7_9SPHN|nr:hypothetical protein EBBID32_6890 [Sphingobium indicum BiD32]